MVMAYWPAGNTGFWGDATSLVDWCESNYEVTHFVAEFWNTVSNLPFFLLAYIGIQTLRELRVTELRDYLGFLSLVMISIGSILFHGTMQYHAQILDEIPMIY
ncbi:Alkaline ceramidase 3, partial [Rhizoclosmatium sp. JEL0117]